MADAVLVAEIVYRGETAATVAGRALRGAGEPQEGLRALGDELMAIAAGSVNAKVTARVDSHTGDAFEQTITFVQGDLTAGDTFTVRAPSGQDFLFTAVASGPTAASGEFSIETDATAVGASVLAAMNAVPGFTDYFTPTVALGVITLVATETGAQGAFLNHFTSVENTGTAIVQAATVLPYDPGAAPSATIAVTHAELSGDETITIGGITLTWKASPSGEDQIDIKSSDATDAAELARGLAAHSMAAGILTATSADAIVTITYLGTDSRAGEMISLATSDAAAHTLSGVRLDSNLTLASSSLARTYEQGGAP